MSGPTEEVSLDPQLAPRLPKPEPNLLSTQLTAYYSNDSFKMVACINI